jgi:hypothetical protein
MYQPVYRYLPAIVFLFQACSKILDVDGPVNKINGKDVFTNDASATSAVRGIYSAASGSSNLLSGSMTIYPGMYADELEYTGPVLSTADFYKNEISTDNETIEVNFWGDAYKFMYPVNVCIQQLENNKTLTPGVRDQLAGECKFFRALLYLYLIQLFGEVPLITSPDYTVNQAEGRTNIAFIRQRILDDLLSAKELLSEQYPTPERVRVNKWAAVALLARVYLYLGDAEKAEKEATEVINAGIYHLDTPENAFLASSAEAIFQIMPVYEKYNTMEGNVLIPTGASKPVISMRASLISAFEANDKRMSNWVGRKTVNSITYYYPFKYKQRTNFTPSFKLTEYTTVLRLGEIYLIRAESRALQGLLTTAVQDIDSIRKRAGLPLIAVTNPGITQAALLDRIQKERRIELFAEWGHRWFDLKRKGKAAATLSVIKPGWKDTDTLWPIPASQIKLNSTLQQNPGYE